MLDRVMDVLVVDAVAACRREDPTKESYYETPPGGTRPPSNRALPRKDGDGQRDYCTCPELLFLEEFS
jgi:hypothetical protein